MKQITTPAELIALLQGNLEAGTPAGIVASEKAGQGVVVNSDILPRESFRGDSKTALEALGIEVTGIHDDLFYAVKLPAGWGKEGTEHNMWSVLKDETGKVRAEIFYKAAFYDRKANIRLAD